MAKITLEYFNEVMNLEWDDKITIQMAVEMLNDKASEADPQGELMCPHCNSMNTDIIHAVSHCECSDCNQEFEA